LLSVTPVIPELIGLALVPAFEYGELVVMGILYSTFYPTPLGAEAFLSKVFSWRILIYEI